MTSFIRQCDRCEHYQGSKKCSAFPEGIAPEVFFGYQSHKDPIDGDNGIQFQFKKSEQSSTQKGSFTVLKYNPYHDSKGRFTTGPGKGGASDVSPTSIHASNALQYGLGSARDEVLSYDDGLEHSVGVDKNGTPFFAKDGEADHVTFTDEEMGMLKGAHLIHNHPNNSGLSIGDVLFSGNCGLKSIEAVTQDGSVFKCVPSKSLKSPQGRAIASITHDLAQETFGPSISMNLFSGYFGHEEANRILGNMTMEVLHELGVIKHSMKLSAETARSEARVPEDARVALKAAFYDRLSRSLVNAPEDVKQFIKKNKMFSENLVDPIIYET